MLSYAKIAPLCRCTLFPTCCSCMMRYVNNLLGVPSQRIIQGGWFQNANLPSCAIVDESYERHKTSSDCTHDQKVTDDRANVKNKKVDNQLTPFSIVVHFRRDRARCAGRSPPMLFLGSCPFLSDPCTASDKIKSRLAVTAMFPCLAVKF